MGASFENNKAQFFLSFRKTPGLPSKKAFLTPFLLPYKRSREEWHVRMKRRANFCWQVHTLPEIDRQAVQREWSPSWSNTYRTAMSQVSITDYWIETSA